MTEGERLRAIAVLATIVYQHPPVDRLTLRAALVDIGNLALLDAESQEKNNESELSWDDLHHGPLTATEGFRRQVKEITKQFEQGQLGGPIVKEWTGLMAGFVPPAEPDRSHGDIC